MLKAIKIYLIDYLHSSLNVLLKETKPNCENISKEKCNTTSYYFNTVVSLSLFTYKTAIIFGMLHNIFWVYAIHVTK